MWETESGKYSPLFYSKIELFFNITNVKEMGRRNKCLLGTNYVAGPMPALHSILEAGMVIPILRAHGTNGQFQDLFCSTACDSPAILHCLAQHD